MDKRKYAGVDYLTIKEANDEIISYINSGNPFMAARVGETELGTIRAYDHPLSSVRDFRIYSNNICINAGFFPKNVLYIKRFCEQYKTAINDIDLFGAFHWKSEEDYLMVDNCLKYCFPASVFDITYDDVSWYSALKDKRVLVVNPFSTTIEEQYQKKDHIFLINNKINLPDFKLITYKSVQSIGGQGATGFKTWFDALNKMKEDIGSMDFDIALLGCGAYGVPLAAYIKGLGKQAIYVGGCLQLFFGIIGKRWENVDRVNRFFNDYWTRPSEKEKTDSYYKVEDGCYW